ncbi:MAG: prepilin-type N-terminal cleavage/methylation domain-containing protein [Candidatus Melainabacteria bacterium]|nr:prepilin-type N-terminal cleavage/methylation domain-containing protein [Candidatus Melainabacteria bacterium]
MKLNCTRNFKGYSLIETMTVIAVLAIVVGLLYAYSDQGWKLFYQSYGRGLSQVKAKLAIKVISDELRESNKDRLVVGQGTSYGVPIPDDAKDNSPYIYFTKPKFNEGTGDIIAYDYVLFYFAKPKKNFNPYEINSPKISDNDEFIILKSIKFLNQSKHYTEDEEKTWPFMPPIIEIDKSTLPEDESNFAPQTQSSSGSINGAVQTPTPREDTQFLDHFTKLKRVSKNVPISGNFIANSLTDPFTKQEVSIFFNQSYSTDNPIKIKVSLQESPFLFGLMGAMTEFEVSITPRN